ncbi:MAG: NAD(P)H-binding protein [Dehalococcoidia bacterium]|nr:NAD(P)H-binding protein [Dehalococcoidia bacterium]
MRVFVAGGWGAVGRVLCPLLVDAGHEVTGTTRSPERAAALEGAGARAAVVDVYDAEALRRAVLAARPEVVIHQLTDLAGLRAPGGPAPGTLEANSRIRVEGTRHLVAAAVAAGASRLIAQSICWLYAEGPLPHAERDPLREDPPGTATIEAVRSLEDGALRAEGLAGLVLRYGRFYGPATGVDEPPSSAPVHVEAAAWAAALAVERGAPGIYNVAEDDGYVSIEQARRELGWDPALCGTSWRVRHGD